MTNTHRAEVIIIGAGLVGAAVGFELATRGVRTLVLEAGPEPAAGVSRSNSGIVHTGFDSTPGTLETAMIRAQAQRWQPLFDALGVAYRIPGALLVAASDAQEALLPSIAAKAKNNGVHVELLSAAEVRVREPHVAGGAGLLVPGEAITDPFELVRRLLASGPELRLNTRVLRVEPDGEEARVETTTGNYGARYVINCAGLYADEIAADNSFRITPRRGAFLAFDPAAAHLIEHMLLPVPSEYTKGVLIFPTLYGHLCIGPSATDQDDKEDWRPHADELAEVHAKALHLLPALREFEPVEAWAGLRPVGYPHNYLVDWSERVPSMLHVAGIRSTGLSACLGLSQHVLDLLLARGLEVIAQHLPSAPQFDDSPRPWWQRLNALRGVSGNADWH